MGQVTAHYSNRGQPPQYFDDRYEIFSTIGRGHSSVVYLSGRYSATDTIDIDSPPVALKVLLNTEKDSASAMRRIKRESLALLSSIHPAIIRMYDYVAREDMCYMSMEYAKYGDLKKLFSENKNFLSPRATLKLIQNLLSGVGAIHSAGILHRDLKPENILLAEDYQVKICDFSVCLLRGERPNIEVLKEVVGTIDYLPPECLNGAAYSVSSDLYSVGVTCFELLAGYKPFNCRSIADSLESKIKVQIKELPPQVQEEFPQLDEFFRKALNANPAYRYLTHKEMSAALEGILTKTYPASTYFNAEEDTVREPTEEVKPKIVGALNAIAANLPLIKQKIIRLLNYFVTSFVLTLVAFLIFSILRIERVRSTFGSLFLKSEVTAAPESIESSQQYFFQMLSQNPGIGVLRGLYTKEKDYRFVIAPAGNKKAIFGILISGWQPVEVNLDELLEGKPIHVVGKGVEILLKVEKIESNLVASGTFENLITARMGRWELEFSSKLKKD